MKYDNLREGLVELLNSFNYNYSLYDANGRKTSNPYLARYVYVSKPNMMFIIDEENNKVEFHKSNFNFKTFKKLLNVIRRITMEYFINLEVSNYNKEFKAKDFSKDIMRRRYNLDKNIETLDESAQKNGMVLYESYDTVVIKECEKSYHLIDSKRREFDIDKSMYAMLPHLAERAEGGLLSESYLNEIKDLKNKYKVLDEKMNHDTMSASERDLYKKMHKFLKTITF